MWYIKGNYISNTAAHRGAIQASCYPMTLKTNCTTMVFEKFCITTRTKKTSTRCVLVFLFRCERGLEQQRRRPLPAAETGRSCWGRVLIFQSPVRGLRKNQQTQPVRRRAAPQAISPVGCCLARGSHPIGMSNVEAVRECREIERFHGFFVFSAWHAGSFAPRPKTAPFPEK